MLSGQITIRCSIKKENRKNMSEKIADVIKETENNKADRQEQYFFRTDQLTVDMTENLLSEKSIFS